MKRYTEYHAGVAVIKDKTNMKEAMARFAELEERDTPKKPITYTDTNRADCPICGMTVRGIAKPYGDFCSKCGQRLDWGDDRA